MNVKRTGLSQLILLAVMCLGGWLALGSGVRLLTGFILLVGSSAWLLFLARRKLSQPLAQREVEVWSRVSESGKSRYIRKAVIMGLLVGVVSSSLVLFNSIKDKGVSAEGVEIFAATVLIVTFVFYYAAVRIWDATENRNKKP